MEKLNTRVDSEIGLVFRFQRIYPWMMKVNPKKEIPNDPKNTFEWNPKQGFIVHIVCFNKLI